MSLLYECINGIIQGGILESTDETNEGESIARLCVGKLRAMMVIEGDPNRKDTAPSVEGTLTSASVKYVALLAFQKIVPSHPHLVSLHQDVILASVDDADISIRLRALDLIVNMVDSENLISVVERLTKQLRSSPAASNADHLLNNRGFDNGIEPAADSEDEDPEESLRPAERKLEQPPPLPVDYRIAVIRRILDMCSRDTYALITDFSWYVDVLVQLIWLAPGSTLTAILTDPLLDSDDDGKGHKDVSSVIGAELLNVAVRVKSVRVEATRAAEALVSGRGGRFILNSNPGSHGVLGSAAWIVGEYATYLEHPNDTLTNLIHSSRTSLPPSSLILYLQAIPKVFAVITGNEERPWNPERKSLTSLLIARVVHFLEELTTHPDLEVQERSVEFIELMRLAADAVKSHPSLEEEVGDSHPPLLLTQVIPALFEGLDLNPVAPAAQRKVPVPEELDLETSINPDLHSLLQTPTFFLGEDIESDESRQFYHQRPKQPSPVEAEPAAVRLRKAESETLSYQLSHSVDDADEVARRRAERLERNKDDPYYIPTEDNSEPSTRIHTIIKSNNGPDLDIDSIPIMDLNLDSGLIDESLGIDKVHAERRQRKKVDIAGDENVWTSEEVSADNELSGHHDGDRFKESRGSRSKGPKSLLQVDSSGLRSFSFDSTERSMDNSLDPQMQEEDEEMARALREVERVRLEMQRASERIQPAQGVPPEGTLIRKKPKKKKKLKSATDEDSAKRPKKKRSHHTPNAGQSQGLDLGNDGDQA